MMPPTSIASSDTRTTAAPRLVVWIELSQPATAQTPAELSREPWYDPAALYEEPERWDGLA